MNKAEGLFFGKINTIDKSLPVSTRTKSRGDRLPTREAEGGVFTDAMHRDRTVTTFTNIHVATSLIIYMKRAKFLTKTFNKYHTRKLSD